VLVSTATLDTFFNRLNINRLDKRSGDFFLQLFHYSLMDSCLHTAWHACLRPVLQQREPQDVVLGQIPAFCPLAAQSTAFEPPIFKRDF